MNRRRGSYASDSASWKQRITKPCGPGFSISTGPHWPFIPACSRASRKSWPPSRGLDCAGGDTLPERTPHPLPLPHAAALLRLEPSACACLGDAERDVQAARNAGMIPPVAGFGYRNDGENPAAWQPEAVFGRPEELLNWLGPRE